MTQASISDTAIAARSAPPDATRGFRLPTHWLGVAPFFIFALMFLILPTLYLVIGAFQNDQGQYTLDNIRQLFLDASIRDAYWVSIKISFWSATIGAFIGLAMAIAIVRGGLPSWVRSSTMTFSGVASNFAGVPLAFAFLATLGRLGLVTVLLRGIGIDIYALGFNVLTSWGLIIVYLFFQIPLMIVIITPAIDGLKREWGEAAATLGATTWQYWRMVVIPVLWPSFLGTVILLFANSFGAIATAYAFTGSSLNIVPIKLYAQIRGDVLHNPHLGYALAFGMIVVTGLANIFYIWFRTRSERWLK
ncbi:ABC transporter permease subunit [Aminobacter aminovorans]|uniref:ABC transporter permease n=1 Tax=Aminobacter TaxID=31988 RepID=UPI0028679BAC|nr:ABC transporter permease subunit [Aminobacter aminovorans]MDR7222090.1 putative spermidine/putrescine transport system permease protein [Aminobacter aminovorans]